MSEKVAVTTNGVPKMVTYVGWIDHPTKTTLVQRINRACVSYADRHGTVPNLVLIPRKELEAGFGDDPDPRFILDLDGYTHPVRVAAMPWTGEAGSVYAGRE